MSLDVSAYPHFELLQAGEFDETFESQHADAIGETIVYLASHLDFPAHAEGYVDGYYRVARPPNDVDLNFRYSNFNFWRDHLCRMCSGRPVRELWNDEFEAPAFGALLNFGDNEGFIGPERCRQLAADFAKWEDRIVAYAANLAAQEDEKELADAFLKSCASWRRALEAVIPFGILHYH